MDAHLADFVRARYPQLLRRAYLLTGDRARAEDLTQEALARACAAAQRRALQDLDAYLRATMVNLSVNAWRRRARLHETPTAAMPEVGLPDGTAEGAERSRMWQALGQISRRQRAVLVLRFYEDLDEAQIADVLGVSVGTVRSHTARGLSRMRAGLADLDEVEESS